MNVQCKRASYCTVFGVYFVPHSRMCLLHSLLFFHLSTPLLLDILPIIDIVRDNRYGSQRESLVFEGDKGGIHA